MVEGGRGSGKSHGVARYMLIKGMENKIRILCTREVQKTITDSVHKLLIDLIHEYSLPYKSTQTNITGENGTEFIFGGLKSYNSANIKSLEGVDLCWVEQAERITMDSLNILLPTIRKPGSRIIYTMNRILDLDPVFELLIMRKRDDVDHVKINYYENPFCSRELIAEAEICKQTSLNDYMHIWEGQPIRQGDNCILSLQEIRDAMERKVEAQGQLDVGVDVARFGDDQTVISVRRGHSLLSISPYKGLRTYETAEKTITSIKKHLSKDDKLEQVSIKVDDTGLGSGVTDELVRQHMNVIPINNGQVPKNENKYDHAITEMWDEFSSLLPSLSLPYHIELLRELSTRQYSFNSKRQKAIEPKDNYKKRFGKSCDFADSVLLCFYNYSGIGDLSRFKPSRKLEYYG